MAVKKLVGIIAVALTLSACSEPAPMNKETVKAFKECQDKNWIPRYVSNRGGTEFSCRPQPVPMNEYAAAAFEKCALSGKNAIYDASANDVICVDTKKNINLRD